MLPAPGRALAGLALAAVFLSAGAAAPAAPASPPSGGGSPDLSGLGRYQRARQAYAQQLLAHRSRQEPQPLVPGAVAAAGTGAAGAAGVAEAARPAVRWEEGELQAKSAADAAGSSSAASSNSSSVGSSSGLDVHEAVLR